MGANGSHASGVLESEENRKYYTLFSLGENIKFLDMKIIGRGGKLPEESHTPNRIYVSLKADGSTVKEIAKYGDDGKKVFVIHTAEHQNHKTKEKISPHYHKWENGKQLSYGYPLTTEMQQLLMYIRNYGHAKQQKK